MGEVEVRQWSDHVFAAYVFDGDPLGRFVGTAATREAARELALHAPSWVDGAVHTCTEKCCHITDPAGVADGDAERSWENVAGRAPVLDALARPQTSSTFRRNRKGAVLL